MPSRFYVTTAIDYVNAEPHIGHAYEKIVTDCPGGPSAGTTRPQRLALAYPTDYPQLIHNINPTSCPCIAPLGALSCT